MLRYRQLDNNQCTDRGAVKLPGERDGNVKFYVVALARGDEFTEGIFDTIREAIQCADTAWYHLTPQERKKQTIEVRCYKNNIDEDEADFTDYDTIDWQNTTKVYMDIDTGIFWSLEEVKDNYERHAHEMSYDSFDDYLEEALDLGAQGICGLVEVE